MKSLEYLEYLKNYYEVYYDLDEHYEYNGYEFDLYARYHEKRERYVASKKIVIYAQEANEHVLYKHFNSICLDELKEYIEILKSLSMVLVKPNQDHMSSIIRGVISVDVLPDEKVLKYLKKFKFYKSFSFGFKGWVNVALDLVDLHDGCKVYHNKMGKVGKVRLECKIK